MGHYQLSKLEWIPPDQGGLYYATTQGDWFLAMLFKAPNRIAPGRWMIVEQIHNGGFVVSCQPVGRGKSFSHMMGNPLYYKSADGVMGWIENTLDEYDRWIEKAGRVDS